MKPIGRKLITVAGAAKLSAMSYQASASCEADDISILVNADSNIYESASSQTDDLSKSGENDEINAGTLFAKNLGDQSTIDFIVSGIPTGENLSLYIVSSLEADGTWPEACSGSLGISGGKKLEILYAASLNTKNILAKDVSLGQVSPGKMSVSISVKTNDLFEDDTLPIGDFLYLQALVVRGSGLDFATGSASELLEIMIDRETGEGAGKSDDEPIDIDKDS